MQALTAEKLSRMIEGSRSKIAELDADSIAELDKGMAIDFEEHFQFQELQAQAHVQQILATDAAQIVYRALGEAGSESNGGWASGADLATKVIITQLMGELLTMKINAAVQ